MHLKEFVISYGPINGQWWIHLVDDRLCFHCEDEDIKKCKEYKVIKEKFSFSRQKKFGWFPLMTIINEMN